ncbi:MAG TPA: acetate--CoA ligase family protein, partial [Dehalococcoidia bacterium]|nr:acetate--CoA ligase family protein [Dehalococcoidia bacterium]
MSELDAFFYPRSIAVLGASDNPGRMGYRLLENLVKLDFQGQILPINPRGGQALGLAFLSSVTELPSAVDLALVSIPSPAVNQAVEECARQGVRAMVVLSSGFGETGWEGAQSEARMLAVAREAGMRIVGPNCMGVYNLAHRCNASYFWDLPLVEGNVSFLSQSGAFGGIFLREMGLRGVGIAKFVSLGNMVDVTQAEFLDYLLHDPGTRVIALFIEGLRDGPRFLEAAREVSRHKPIVALKAGRTSAGKRAALSHTGTLAGEPRAFASALRQAGVILAQTSDEFFDACTALSAYSNSLPANDAVAIVTISGGPGVIAADTCEEVGLAVPRLNNGTAERLRGLLASFASPWNPVDMTANTLPDNYASCLELVASEDSIGGLLAINVGLDVPQYGAAVAQAKSHGKPILTFTSDTPGVSQLLRAAGIPGFPSGERCVRAYRSLVDYREARARLERPASLAEPLAPSVLLGSMTERLAPAARRTLTEYRAKQVLAEYGIPVSREELAATWEQAEKAAGSMGYPVALKVCSEKIAHKSQMGGVCLDLRDLAALRQAWERLCESFPAGTEFLLQEMAAGELEVIVGAKEDATFGKMVLFGMGGILAELLQEVSVRVCPIDGQEALAMIQESRCYPLFTG